MQWCRWAGGWKTHLPRQVRGVSVISQNESEGGERQREKRREIYRAEKATVQRAVTDYTCVFKNVVYEEIRLLDADSTCLGK